MHTNKVIRIGNLEITKKSEGNSNHGKFFHNLFCGIVRCTSETILCNPPITTEKDYYKCGFLEETTYREIEN